MNLKHGSGAVKIMAMIIIIVLQFVFGDYSIAHATTKLIFRIRSFNIIAGKQAPANNNIDVSPYRKIRIVVRELPKSVSNVTVRLTVLDGTEQVGEIESVTLSPGTSQTKVFDLPGTNIAISAEAQAAASGNDTIDILIYGSD